MKLLKERHLNINYWDLAPNSANFPKMHLEDQLNLLALHDLHTIKNFSDLDDEADLLVIDALVFDEGNISTWFSKLHENIVNTQKIWIPTLIITDSTDFVLSDLNKLVMSNWYFDFIIPDQLSSLPIRCINLIKINDHTQELHRYERKLADLEQQVDLMKAKVSID